mgnify:CR=1 FL=1
MKHILIIGATGQIGSELTMELRKRYGNANVVAGYIPGAEPKGELKESGPSAIADVTDAEETRADKGPAGCRSNRFCGKRVSD